MLGKDLINKKLINCVTNNDLKIKANFFLRRIYTNNLNMSEEDNP